MKYLSVIRRQCSRSIQSLSRGNELFDAEQKRQRNDVGRIEKIEVTYEGRLGPKKLAMNRYLSTPYNVAQHIAEWLCNDSPLALINGTTAWDMHRPIEDSCTLSFLNFTDSDPFLANKSFWKSCSVMLGAVVSSSFGSHVTPLLHSFPSPHIASGSFVYDAALNLPDWSPTPNELRVLSSELVKLSHENHEFERLTVSEELASAIFSENHFKLKQIPNIARSSGGRIVLYRIGQHIDISKGPLIGNTSLLGRASVTAVHKIESDDGPLYRFQGVALPKGLMLNHFAYKILEDRAAKLNRSSFSEKMEQIA